MILFAEDWKRPLPDGGFASYDDTTRNLSFLKMTMTLSRMGIKNNIFPLAIHNRDLIGHDPHNLTDPSIELRLAIAQECRDNLWYFLREVCRVPAEGGDPIAFRLHRGNLAMAWCYFVGLDFACLQPRQTGKTMMAIILFAYVLYIYGFNMSLWMLTHSADLAQKNVDRIKKVRNALPPYLVLRQGTDTDNKEGLSHRALENSYKTAVAQKDRKQARNVLRGETVPSLHVDEFAHNYNIDISFPALMPATSTARKLAAANGMPHSNIYTMTPAPLMDPSGEFSFQQLQKAFAFTEKLYDAFGIDEAHRIVKAGSTNGWVNGTFSYLQLGYTHEWFVEETTRGGLSQADIDRDYLLLWKTEAEFSVLPEEVRRRLQAGKAEPNHVQLYGDYAVAWYVPEAVVNSPAFRARPLILGMDTSDAIGRDFTAMALIDPAAGMRTVATFRCNESNLTNFGLFVGEFLVQHPGVLLAPERKSSAAGIIDTVILVLQRHGINPFTRIFNKLVQEKDTTEFRDLNLHDPQLINRAGLRRHLGFQTTGESRAYLFKNVLTTAASFNAERVFDKTLIDELCGLAVRNGRVDHGPDDHDDLAMAWLIACYVVFEGKNLQYYGINPDSIVLPVGPGGVAIDPVQQRVQADLKRQIAHLTALVEQTTHLATREHLKQRLRLLRLRAVDPTPMQPVSRDAVRQDLTQYAGAYGASAPTRRLPTDDMPAMFDLLGVT